MATSSNVYVRLNLTGGERFSADAKRAGGSLEGVGASARVANRELQGVGSGSTVASTRLGRAITSARKGEGAFGGVKSAVLGATGALSGIGSIAGIGAGFGLFQAAKGAIDFDAAMRNVNSIAQLAPGRFAALEKSVNGLAGKTAQAPVTLAQGLYDLVSSGFKAAPALRVLRSAARAATAGLTDTATSTKVIAGALNAYNLPAKQASHVTDLLFQTVNKGVISFEELAQGLGQVMAFAPKMNIGLNQIGAAISMMTIKSIPAAESMTDLKDLINTFNKPSKAMSAAVRATGAASGEALVRHRGLQGALKALVATTDGTGEAMHRLFPDVRAGAAAAALTGKNARAAANMLRSFGHVVGATNRALAQQSNSITNQWHHLTSAIQAATNTVLLRFRPAVSGVLGKTAKLIQGLTGNEPARRLPFKRPTTIGQGKANQLTELVPPKALSGMTKIGERIRAVITNVVKAVVPQVKAMVTQFITAIKPATPFLKNVLLPLLKGIAIGVIGGVVGAFKVAIPIIRILATVLGAVGKVLAPFRGVIEKIGVVIGIVFAPKILEAVTLLGKFGRVGRLVAAVARLMLIPIRFVGRTVRVVAGAFRGAAVGMGVLSRWLGIGETAFGRLLGKVTGFVGGVGRSLESLPGRAARAIGGMIGKLKNGLTSAANGVLNAAKSIGAAIIRGIVNAIKASPGAIVKAIKNVVPSPLRGPLSSILGLAKDAVSGNANGGLVRTPLQLVGERGPELAALPIGSRVFTHGQTQRMMASRSSAPTQITPQTIVIHPTVVVHSQLDGRTFHTAVHKVERQIVEAA